MKNTLIIFLILSSFLISQVPNYKVSSTETDPNEVSIAVNPVDENNLIAGANLNYYYYSTNKGISWIKNSLSSTFGVWGDPCIIFDPQGNAYYGHLSNAGGVGGYWIDRIVVQKSTNKGLSWNTGVGIGYNPPYKEQDKEWMISDWTNSQYRGNIYVSWTEFDNYGSSSSSDSSRILFSRSTNGGLTFSSPVRISEKGGNCVDEDLTVEGAVPAVGPNGEVYLSWAGPLGLMFDKSVDGGLTWGLDKFVTTIPGGWDFSISAIQRANGLPITACDISNSPYRGNIYINWSDQRNGVTNTDVFIVKSTNGGLTWTSPKKVNQDNSSKQQFFCWMTVDPASGYIYIIYYDRRNYTDNKTDVYMSVSKDGGETFNDIKLSQSSFTPVSSVFFGDYTNITALNGKVYPIWMRGDGSNLSVWTAPFTDTISAVPSATVSFNSGWNLFSIPLNTSDMSISNLLPDKVSNVFEYENQYKQVDTLKVGKGYWVKFNEPKNYNVSGSGNSTLQVPVSEGWNLIGSLNGNIDINTVSTNPPNILTSQFYEFNGMYQSSSVLTKGKGYWVKSNSSGTINLNINLFKNNKTYYKEIFDNDYDRLIVTCKELKKELLLINKIFDKELYELPPLPPDGNFDVRFKNGLSAANTSENIFITTNNMNEQYKVKFITSKGSKITFSGKNEIQLKNGDDIEISGKDLESYGITYQPSSNEYFISQNYPNPFNGACNISFYIPKNETLNKFNVSVSVFDLLGRYIKEIYSGSHLAYGYHQFNADFTKYNLSSGIYFYQIKIFDTENQILIKETKKLNFIK